MVIFLHNQQEYELLHTPTIHGGRETRVGDQNANNGHFNIHSEGFQMAAKKMKNVFGHFHLAG